MSERTISEAQYAETFLPPYAEFEQQLNETRDSGHDIDGMTAPELANDVMAYWDDLRGTVWPFDCANTLHVIELVVYCRKWLVAQ